MQPHESTDRPRPELDTTSNRAAQQREASQPLYYNRTNLGRTGVSKPIATADRRHALTRIVVWGVTGSGKTSFARRLGRALDLPAVELDAIRHRNGWDSTPLDAFRDELAATLDGHVDGWVVEGSYSAIMDVYLSRADTLLWLHLPFRVSFWRLLRRTIARARDQQPLYHPDGPHESWRQAFFSRQSILWWAITNHRRHQRVTPERIADLPAGVRVHELRSARAVTDFLNQVTAAAPASTRTDV